MPIDLFFRDGGFCMNWEQIEGRLLELRGRIRESWAKITGKDMQQIAGKKDRLLGKVQQRYGKKKEEIGNSVDHLISEVDGDDKTLTKH
jgi:uncharacterized protein YjbJ (UPF0337 family)